MWGKGMMKEPSGDEWRSSQNLYGNRDESILFLARTAQKHNAQLILCPSINSVLLLTEKKMFPIVKRWECVRRWTVWRGVGDFCSTIKYR